MLVVTPVEPIGEYPTAGFVTRTDGRCGVKTWMAKRYPPSPDGTALRELRVQLGLTLGQGARLLGITPAQMCDLEFGRATADYDEIGRIWRASR